MTQETYELLEEAVQKQLKQIENVDSNTKEGKEVLQLSINLAQLLITTDKDNADYYDKEEKRRIEEERNKAMDSVEREKQRIEEERNKADYYDKEEKRRIEEERNKAMDSVERDKQKLTWQRVCFEMAKVVVPLAIQIVAFGSLQGRMFKFEETGRVTSTGGREMHLPKFWK